MNLIQRYPSVCLPVIIAFRPLHKLQPPIIAAIILLRSLFPLHTTPIMVSSRSKALWDNLSSDQKKEIVTIAVC